MVHSSVPLGVGVVLEEEDELLEELPLEELLEEDELLEELPLEEDPPWEELPVELWLPLSEADEELLELSLLEVWFVKPPRILPTVSDNTEHDERTNGINSNGINLALFFIAFTSSPYGGFSILPQGNGFGKLIFAYDKIFKKVY